jgi:hypothetical protein
MDRLLELITVGVYIAVLGSTPTTPPTLFLYSLLIWSKILVWAHCWVPPSELEWVGGWLRGLAVGGREEWLGWNSLPSAYYDWKWTGTGCGVAEGSGDELGLGLEVME